MMMTNDPALASLLAEAEKLEELAKQARHKYEQQLCENYSFKVGDVIKSSKGQMALITHIAVNKYGEPRMTAVLRKQDGFFGKRLAPLWRSEWNNPERVDLLG